MLLLETVDAIRAGKAGSKPLAEHIRKQEEKRQVGPKKQAGKEQTAEPFYDRDALIANLVRIVEDEAMWERELEASELTPAITIDYEDIPPARDELLLQIAELLGLPDPAAIVANRDREDIKLQKQSDSLTEEWYDRFISG